MPSPLTDAFGLRQWLRRAGRIAALALCLGAAAPSAAEIRVLVQSSPLAGSQYYAVDAVRAKMRVGDALTLVREPDNRHDANAIRVEWQGHQLGYVPRRENRALAAAIDAGEAIVARISKLKAHKDPWKRLEFEVFVSL
jgi:hypothetical protein